MKTYKFEVTITEGNDEWWKAIGSDPALGPVQEAIENHLFNAGFDAIVTLKSFHMDNES